MSQIIHTALLIAGALTALFGILLALPKSQLRAFLLPIIGWAFALFCGAYIISPVDLLPEALLGPFGAIDDAGALVAGIGAALMAIHAGKEQRDARP